jgi:hypothetical protein
VLLTSVFGPFAQDDEFGSRRINPMELYHNQVTRLQGPFSLRMFHRTWGIMLLSENVTAPCTVLDFPTLDRFVEELKRVRYDVIGISSIIANIRKVKKMCELVRQYQPGATLVVGGHIASKPDLSATVDADHIVRGEGVRWLREFLGEDPDRPVRHPRISSGFGARTMGLTLPEAPERTAATVIPSVGCPMGCNFCATSALFGGKGNAFHFLETGDKLFETLCELERDMKTTSFFVMDENFLLHRKRALRLLELMEQHGKPWSLYAFSSAKVLKSYSMEQLLGLGLSWVWMGLEGERSRYAKLKGTDTHELIRELQANGIRVLGSSIIGLEEHTPENIDEVIDFAIAHDTEFHQFMLYTPLPGTPLHAEHQKNGTLLPESECADADAHGQFRFKHRHPHIVNGAETELLLRAFRRDFEQNGPSVVRVVRTALQGFKRHKDHPNPRVRARIHQESEGLSTVFAGALWATERWFRRSNPTVAARAAKVRRDLVEEFGLTARLSSATIGPAIAFALWREDRAMKAGKTYEPPTFYEKNRAAALELAEPVAGAALVENPSTGTPLRIAAS